MMNKIIEFRLKEKTIDLMKQNPKPDEKTIERALLKSVGFIDYQTRELIEILACHSQFNKIENIINL